MRFTPQFLDELRARLPVSEVVGKRVKLKRAGREWKGLSPFQQEKTPSFTVNDQKGFYHDFSSGKHGDIISFLMETEGVGFTEAVERLASMAGVPLPAVTPDAAREQQRRKTLYDVMDLAAKFFSDTLASRKGANLYNHAPARQATHDGASLVVVEGYVDVIAMVTAGFAASVAPLGTALTESQLALLWKMADEPILCFDGDKAGQKAAYRAADMALPHLKPGKSLRFALLPEGQDPDDLARSGGRGAIEEVISAARGLADVIWSREIEGGTFATPERRAALEARIRELSNGIGDEVVRRYYRQDLSERLQRTFAPEVARGGYGRGGYRAAAGNFGSESGRRFAPRGVFTPGAAGRFEPRGGRGLPGTPTINRGPYQAASPQLALSPIMRGQRSAISRREALILQSLINHPWLLHDHLEEAAALELAHPEAHRLRAGIISAFANDHHHSPEPSEQSEKMRADLAAAGVSQALQRVERAITTSAAWRAQAGAAREDGLSSRRQGV